MHLGAQLCLETLEAIIAADGHPDTMAQEDSLSTINYQLSTINYQLAKRSPSEALKSAPKIFKETCEINWSKTAKQVYDFVRGLSPVPGAWTTLVAPDGKETVLKVYKTRKTDRQGQGSGVISTDGKALYISAADRLLEIVELQLAGKKRMLARDFLNGMKNIEQYRVKKNCDSI